MRFLPGLLKTQEGGIGAFTQLLVGTLTFAKGRSIPYHVENVILDLEGQADIFRIAIQRGVQLARQGQSQLQQAEQRVQILLADSEDSPTTPFTPDAE